MLAKLKVLRQEDKALQEIETKLRAQLNRLKQEERVLRRQMRKTHERSLSEDDQEVTKDSEPHVDDEIINQEPLQDLNERATSILQMCQAQYIEEKMDTEEEEDEGEEEENDIDEENEYDNEGGVEDEIGAEYKKLFKEMRAEVDYEDDFEDC